MLHVSRSSQCVDGSLGTVERGSYYKKTRWLGYVCHTGKHKGTQWTSFQAVRHREYENKQKGMVPAFIKHRETSVLWCVSMNLISPDSHMNTFILISPTKPAV